MSENEKSFDQMMDEANEVPTNVMPDESDNVLSPEEIESLPSDEAPEWDADEDDPSE